jgi:hypothetical protein
MSDDRKAEAAEVQEDQELSDLISKAASLMGKKGGRRVLETKGVEHFQRMGEISGGQKEVEELSDMGKKGGSRTFERHGKEHYSEMGKKGRRARIAPRKSYHEFVLEQGGSVEEQVEEGEED